MNLRDMVRQYIIDNYDQEVDSLDPITEKDIDENIREGVETFGSEKKLEQVLREYLGIKG